MVDESKTEEKFDQELEKLRQRIIEIETSQKKIQKSIRPKFLYITASLFILLSVAYILLIFSMQKKQKTISPPFKSEKTVKTVIVELPLVLEIIAEDTTWILAGIDNNELKELLLNPGERTKLYAKKGFSLKIGNAGGTRLIFNGKDIGPIGEEGQVVRVKLPSS